MFDFLTSSTEVLNQPSALRRFACTIQTFENDKLASIRGHVHEVGGFQVQSDLTVREVCHEDWRPKAGKDMDAHSVERSRRSRGTSIDKASRRMCALVHSGLIETLLLCLMHPLTHFSSLQSAEVSNQLLGDMFSIIVEAASDQLGPRLGQLSTAPDRTPLATPHYLAITSRGVVPHLSPDTFARDTNVVPPIYQFEPRDEASPLRRFIALSDRALCVLGARRTPPVIAPAANPNTNDTVSISTAVGFKPLRAKSYVEGAERLSPDIVVGVGDVPYGRALGSKRVEKAVDRTVDWMRGHTAFRAGSGTKSRAKLFAPLLPVSCAQQQYYVEQLDQDRDISGLAIYSLESLADLPPGMSHLPRLAFTNPETPQEVLRQIALGVDLLTIPFITSATDAGIALSFSLYDEEGHVTAMPNGGHVSIPLGIDMWSSVHEIDLSPLVPACTCYTCTDHHRAYIRHLLGAKEMTGWLLLQIHNHHVMDLFFAAIRESIGRRTFEEDAREFARRVRGYERRSTESGERKRNPAPWTALKEDANNVDTTPPST
nr:queuine trna-ribosyltransferase accessory subunit 2 [Quercus suber]